MPTESIIVPIPKPEKSTINKEPQKNDDNKQPSVRVIKTKKETQLLTDGKKVDLEKFLAEKGANDETKVRILLINSLISQLFPNYPNLIKIATEGFEKQVNIKTEQDYQENYKLVEDYLKEIKEKKVNDMDTGQESMIVCGDCYEEKRMAEEELEE
ncbi:881_t:CDS:2 [Racocetra fulgida]|uniref:881_t:CDS:1 n=1 Tax=Racocetra fulgida TaxID=60492 RepID=A0A9N8WAT6_9GLOM|nr:881_t:CDS:2 [Racocetra fulgida]